MKMGKVLMAIVVLVACLGCPSKITSVPENLIGIWRTESPNYADRIFELRKNEVVFQIGEGKFESHRITNIEKEENQKEKKILYILSYKGEKGHETKFLFYHYPEERGAIRFKNQQEMVWTKQKG